MAEYISSTPIYPAGKKGARILIIGDAPTLEAEKQGIPISATHMETIERASPFPLSDCIFANVSLYRPANGDFKYLEGSRELKESLEFLNSYIASYPPELIITLGEYALRYVTGNYNIENWRGSPLMHKGIKLMPTLSPAIWGVYTQLSFDFNRAEQYLNNNHRTYTDNFTITSDPLEQRNLMDEIIAADTVTIDIETPRDNPEIPFLCVGFGLSAERAICFIVKDSSHYEIIRELIPLIKRPIYHNGLFDVSIFRYFHNIPALRPFFDTMVAQHVLEPELPKGLDFLCSTLTWRPCYWGSVNFSDDKAWSSKRKLEDLYTYNCLDCVVTYEAYEALDKDLNTSANLRRVFEYELDMLEVSMHMSSTGFYVDLERREMLRKALEDKKKYDYTTLIAIAGKPILITSPAQVKKYLYEDLGLPIKRSREGKVSTGEDALVGLINYCETERDKRRTDEARLQWDTKIAILKLILNIRGYEKLLSSYINAGISHDNRMRGVFKVAATESGRWAGAVWWDKTGVNAQTLPRESISLDD